MSIVSPYPPVKIVIEFNEQTGAVACNIFRNGQPHVIPLLAIVAIFTQLITHYIKDSGDNPKYTQGYNPDGKTSQPQ